MEDMSKKTKTLEKENDRLKKKKEALDANIAQMAQERDKDKKAVQANEALIAKLKKIIKQMQEQGRGLPQGMQADADVDEVGELEEESEYEDEYEEGDEEGSDGEFDDDTEEEIHEPQQPAQRPSYGPEPPPARVAQKPVANNTAQMAQATNGHL
jgi:hypothetical protein